MTEPASELYGGDMSARIGAFDWSSTPLGPAESWPQSLRAAVRIVLTSRFSMWASWGPELTFFYNDTYRHDTLGVKHPWALGRPAREVWAEIWEDVAPRVDRVLTSGEATWDEALQLFLERSGFPEETYHTFSYSPLADDDGTTAGLLCVVVEETERVIGERRLATLRDLAADAAPCDTEQELFSAIDRSLAGNPQDLPFAFVYTFVGEHDARPVSGAAPAADGWPVERMLEGAEPVEVELDDDLPLPRGAWAVPPRLAVAVRLLDPGQARPAGFLVAGINPYRPLDDAYHGFLELVGGQIAASLASVRAREAERRRAHALAELDRAKTDFFSNVSHEFRTPLSLILGPAEDALEAAPDPDQHERLSVIFRNALRLQKLVNNLLDFSRIEAGRAEPMREPTDLAAFTADLASMFRSATERAGIELVVDRPDGPLIARVDREMWERIVLNLVSNAFKFTFEGEIRVALRREGADAVLTVTDTGTGIAEADLHGLFERFKRVRNARSRTHEGSGIGLALVQELVRLHGGDVEAGSTPGAGSTFTARIPLEEAAGDVDAAAPTSGAAAYLEEALRWLPSAPETQVVGAGLPSMASTGGQRSRILIADDNADLREYLQRLLAPFWDVETVGDGRAALEAIAVRRPDLMVCDAMMPALDGFQVLAELRADPSTAQLPVIMLSARAGEEAAVEGLAAGADDYLVKPFSSRELTARVRANLDLAELRQAAARATERHAQLLRDVADAAVAINRAATVPAVLEVAAERARALVDAEWTLARLDGDRPGAEAEAPGRVRRVVLTGSNGRALGELLLAGEIGTGGVEADAVLTQLAQVASTRLENALLYDREHRVAETLQRSLLPESLPALAHGELSALYLPGSNEASVGGDWYDALALADGTVALVIGDVVGKGVKAASSMGQLRNAVRAYLLEGYGPAETLARVNRLVDTLGGGFATLIIALADLATGHVRYASAGHPPALVVAADGATRWLENGIAPPVGAAQDVTYREAEDELPASGALVLYTDGLVERRGESIDAGLARLAVTAADSPGHAGTLAARIALTAPETVRPDDVAVLALCRHPVDGEPLVVRLPAEATALAPLRDRLRRWLETQGAARAEVTDVLLAAGEAASNAVEHPLDPASNAIVLEARSDGGVAEIAVRDHGGWSDGPSAEHRGRGMQIMRAIADEGDVRVDRDPAGTTITFRRRLA